MIILVVMIFILIYTFLILQNDTLTRIGILFYLYSFNLTSKLMAKAILPKLAA